VDIDKPVSLVACHQADEFGYLDDDAGVFTADQPFPVHLDLDLLR
jgi:hypothetical protein